MCTFWLTTMLICATASASSERKLTVQDVQVTLIAQVEVPARETGMLSELSAYEGRYVEAGEEMGRLDSELMAMEERRAAIEREIAALKSEDDVDRRYAEKSRDVAQSELDQSLLANELHPKTVTGTEIARLRLSVQKMILSIEQATRDHGVAGLTTKLKDQEWRIAGKRLEHRRILAPISGEVVEIFKRAGEWLNTGDPVLRIIQTDRLRVEAFVDGKEFGANLEGCAVRLLAYPPPGDKQVQFNGHVSFVSPEVQPVTGQVRVWAEVQNDGFRLRPGTSGTLVILLDQKNEHLTKRGGAPFKTP